MRVARRVVALRGPLRAAGPGILDACHRCRSLCGSLVRPPRLAVTAAVAIVPLGVPLGVPLRSAALLWRRAGRGLVLACSRRPAHPGDALADQRFNGGDGLAVGAGDDRDRGAAAASAA